MFIYITTNCQNLYYPEEMSFSERVNSVLSQLHAESALFVKSQNETSNINGNSVTVANKLKKPQSAHPNARFPVLIKWPSHWDFESTAASPLPVVPAVSQENIVVSDLLLCLTGISGEYIKPKPLHKSGIREFQVHPDLESCLGDVAKSILPLASNYSTIVRFVDEQRSFEAGRVNQALGEALRHFLRDYLGVITALQREHKVENLNLQQLYAKVQPYMHTFEVLTEICLKIGSEVKGARTLNLLLDGVRSCSGRTEMLVKHLLENAAVPYMDQLRVWLTRGVVHEPFNELFIENNQLIKERDLLPEEYSEDYWSKCYTICRERVPDFLNPYIELILRTGKYLNVLRQCGVKRPDTPLKEFKYSYKENVYAEGIRLAHETSSAKLMHYLMVDMDLPGHLKSVRNYLLMAKGDLITMFMDTAAPELEKKADDVIPAKLQSLLELALRTCSTRSDSYKDLLRADLHPDSVLGLLISINHGKREIQQNESLGWEAVTLTYLPPWPVSLILSPSALTSYQLMFRHLFFCRHVERLLCRVWLDHKRSDLWAAWALRQRMLLYVHNLEYYMLLEVIEPQWNEFMEKLTQMKNLDDVLDCHGHFLSECLVKCMLNTPKHFKALNQFLKKCVEFCKFMDKCALVDASPRHAMLVTLSEEVVDFCPSESFDAKINEFNEAFTQHVNYLFKTLNDMSGSHRKDQLNDMLYRLDFNSFYKNSVKSKLIGQGKERSESLHSVHLQTSC